MEAGVNYEILNKIRNGNALASKFDSKVSKIYTPNEVVVFTNEGPKFNQLSRGRWNTSSIICVELKLKHGYQTLPFDAVSYQEAKEINGLLCDIYQ